MSNLAPCPWCGETDKRKIIRQSLSGQYCVDHLDGTFNLKTSLTWPTEDEAIRAWNERVTGAASTSDVRELLDTLNAMNAAGRMKYDVYSELFDIVGGLLP